MRKSVGNKNMKQAVITELRKGILGAILIVVVGVYAWQQAEANPPDGDTYSRKFDVPTNWNGMVVVGNVECYKTNNSITFYQIKTNTVMWGHLLPARTGIHFSPDGNPEWCFLSQNWEIHGHLFLRGMGWMTCFYPGGQLDGGGLVNVEVIDGIPCACAYPGPQFFRSNPRTFFYEDGKLKSAEVAVTFRYRGQIIEKGKRVHLKPDGSIETIKANNP